MIRWVSHESGWQLPSNGAPSARLVVDTVVVVTVLWLRNRILTFEGEFGEVAMPILVLEELVRRARHWSWRTGELSRTTGPS
jgi:hypothetical protein